MQLKKIFLTVFMVLSVFGCSQNNSTVNKLSKQEQTDLYRELGVRYYQLGHLEDAKEKLTKALEINPKDAQTHNTLGVLYGRLGETDVAKKHFGIAIALAPDNAKIKNNFGRFLCEQGKYSQAEKYLRSAANDRTNQIQWQVLTNLGHCELLQGHKQKAILYFKKALLQNPEHAPALLAVAKIYYNDGKYMSARAFLERFFSASGELQPADSLYLGYRIETALGADKQAEQYSASLLRQFPDSPEAEKLLLER